MEQKIASLRVERAQPNRIRRVLSRSEHASGQEDEMTPVREEMGPPVRKLALRRIQGGHRSRGAAGGGDAVKACIHEGSEQDDSFAIPGAATPVGSVAQRERSTARGFDLFELGPRE